jgi:predicted NUDIX family phosphoesterase
LIVINNVFYNYFLNGEKMLHYYFDLKDGTRIRDHAGVDLRDDAAAIAYGKDVAEQVSLQKLDDPEMFISIIKEDGRQVAQVRVEPYNVVALRLPAKR